MGGSAPELLGPWRVLCVRPGHRGARPPVTCFCPLADLQPILSSPRSTAAHWTRTLSPRQCDPDHLGMSGEPGLRAGPVLLPWGRPWSGAEHPTYPARLLPPGPGSRLSREVHTQSDLRPHSCHPRELLGSRMSLVMRTGALQLGHQARVGLPQGEAEATAEKPSSHPLKAAS